MSFQSSSLDDPMSDIVNINDDMFTSSVDYNPVNNANLLRDIESLIQSMEHKQTQSQQEENTLQKKEEEEDENAMLRNIDSILSNIKLNESRPHSPQSNISVEPIRMKSPIMMARNDRGKQAAKTTHHISEDVRNFVSNNIQEILPDLVGQVKQELTTNDDSEVFFDATEQDDYFRNRHNEEFEEQLHTPPFMRTPDDLQSHLNDFFLSRHDEEFNERYSPTSRNSHNNNKIVSQEHAEVDKRLSNDYVDDDNVVNDDLIDFLRQRSEEDYLETNDSVDEPAKQQIEHNPMSDIEPLKYKSSYNLKILRKHTKRNKRERDYKRRNSLILGSALLGIDMYPQEKQSSSRPQSTAFNSSKIETLNNLASSQNDSSNIDEKSINHESLITAASFANEINASAEMALHHVDGNNINDNVQEHNRNEVIEGTIEAVVEIIINDEAGVIQQQQHYIINDDTATLGDMSSDIFDDFSNVTTPIPQSSSSVSINDSESIKAPQNLSELVEDTQRLIKQMKDEINAIYVSDEDDEDDEGDDLSGSRYSDEDNWVNSYDDNDEEYGSEYEDWSGEFIESTDPVEKTLIEEPLTEEGRREAFNRIIIIEDTDNNSTVQQQETVITGNAPNVVNEPTQQATTTSAESEESGVVHGKLELALTPLSTNQSKVDASHIESANDDAGGFFNANEGNLSDSSSLTMAAAQGKENEDEEETNEISETQLLSHPPSTEAAAAARIDKSETTNEAINNAIKGKESSIKAINEYIRTISFDEPENIVSLGNDNHSQIALSALPTSSASPSTSSQPPSPKISSFAHDRHDDDDGTNIDSVMNNSVTEVMPKLFDNNHDESIKIHKTELNHDALTAIEEIINSGTSDLTAMSESATTSSYDEASNERNSKSEEMLSNDEKSDSVKNDLSEYAREDMQMASAVTTQQQQQNDESQKSLIISFDVEGRQTNEGVIAMQNDLPLHDPTQENDAEVSKESHQNATSRGSSPSKGARSKIPTKKEKPKETGQQLTNVELAAPSAESNVKLTKTTQRKTSVDNSAASKRKTSTGSSPFGVMLSSNIKSLQSQFLNKASTSSASLKPQITKLKPSKLVPPKILSKDSSPPTTTTATAASKLTKLITPSSMNESTKDVKGSSNNNTASGEEKQQQERNEEPLKDHSKAILPKKNYMEHCFSDEYSTTTDDDEDDIKISPQRDLFTLPKKPNLESDDETSDVRKR